MFVKFFLKQQNSTTFETHKYNKNTQSWNHCRENNFKQIG